MIPVRQYLNLLLKYLRPQRRRVTLLALALSAGIAFQLINPQILRAFIDGAIEGGAQSDLVRLAVLFMVLAVTYQWLGVTATYLAENVGWQATNGLRIDLAAHLLDLDMGFHKTTTPGELIERIDGDVTALSNFFSQLVIRVLGNLVLMIGVLVMLWRESAWIGVGMTAFAAAALVSMIRTQQAVIPSWQKVRERSGRFYGFLGEQLGGTEDIRGNGGTPFFLRRFLDLHRDWLGDQVRAGLGAGTLWSINVAVFGVGIALVFWLGSFFLSEGTLTIGSVYLVFHYTEMLRQPMERIRQQMEDLQKAGAGINRVAALFGVSSRLPSNGRADLPGGPLSVEFRDVTFSYEDAVGDERALHELSFELAPGRVLGVLGRTGSGKTTLARLLTRLYDPRSGEVILGGVDASEARKRSLRSRVGMVSQDVQLFRASVKDNVTFFDSAVSDGEVLAALDALGLRAWVESLPEGIHTYLEAGGSGLSAGQAQLLAFTRIFLKDPGLVILDEASSRLDPATERLIERAVDRLLENRTGIVIAHQLSTVNRVDDVLIMERGRAVEFGNRYELASDRSTRFSQYLAAGMAEVLA